MNQKATSSRDSSPRHFMIPSSSSASAAGGGGQRQGYLSRVAEYMRSLGEEIEQRNISVRVSNITTPSRERPPSPSSASGGSNNRRDNSPSRLRAASPALSSVPAPAVVQHVSPPRSQSQEHIDCQTCERRNVLSPSKSVSPTRDKRVASKLSTAVAGAAAPRSSRSSAERLGFVSVPTNLRGALGRQTPERRADPPAAPQFNPSPARQRHTLAVIDAAPRAGQVAATTGSRQAKAEGELQKKNTARVQFAAVGALHELLTNDTRRAGSSRFGGTTIPNLNHDGARQLAAAIAQNSRRVV
jgi:hypothetical protein